MGFMEIFIEEGKKEGLEAAEESLKLVAKALFRTLGRAANVSENQYIKMLAPIVLVMEANVLQMIDKINPADNEPE